jgi:cytochrome P450
MSSAFHTSGPSSRRYAAKIGKFVARISQAASQVLRAHPPFLVPTPHFSTEDFVYNGMYIPKNTVLVLNLYDIHHNEERYPDSYVPSFPSLISFKAEKDIPD